MASELLINKTPVLPIARASNPFYPLPPDYDTLTDPGKARARINGCRQWLLSPRWGAPASLFEPEAFLYSKMCFDAFYLRRHHFENGGLFYDLDPCPDGPHHDALSVAIHEHSRVVAAMPRGFGKTTDILKTMLTQSISCNGWNTMYASAVYKVCRRFFTKMMREVEQNPFLHADYQLVYGEPPHPTRRPTGVQPGRRLSAARGGAAAAGASSARASTASPGRRPRG
jgi:hypothetical protein